jgi:hypothetical protein
VVVALDDDAPALAALDDAGELRRLESSPPFIVYARPRPGRIPIPDGEGRWRLRAEGESGAWTSMAITYYPLWRVRDQDGALPTRRGPLDDLEVKLVRGDSNLVLTYEPGPAEIAGVAVSVIAVGACLAFGLARRRRSPARDAAPPLVGTQRIRHSPER